jgi:hypothetical protein
MPGPNVRITPSGLNPAPYPLNKGGINYYYRFTAGIAAARLGSFFAGGKIPTIQNPMTFNMSNTPVFVTPQHCRISVPASQAGPIWLTFDNLTVPAVDGPGDEIAPGGYMDFWDSRGSLLTGRSSDLYAVDSASAIQIIAGAAIVFNVRFMD